MSAYEEAGLEATDEPVQATLCTAQILAHIARHLGPIAGTIHSLFTDTVAVQVHVVPATEGFPYLRLVTSGMSDLPMTLPDGVDAPEYMELMVTLPGDWRVDQGDIDSYWPERLLRTLAAFPHDRRTFLAHGHTVSNGVPAAPFAPSVGFDGALIRPSMTAAEEFCELVIDAQKTIVFMSVVPIYPEELALKMGSRSEVLCDQLDAEGVTDIIQVGRANAAHRHADLH